MFLQGHMRNSSLWPFIIQNIVVGLTGGYGVTPGGNIGQSAAIFEQGARHASLTLCMLLLG